MKICYAATLESDGRVSQTLAASPWSMVRCNWTLPLERKSFGLILLSLLVAGTCAVLHMLMSWYARSRLRIERAGMRAHLVRAGKALISSQ